MWRNQKIDSYIIGYDLKISMDENKIYIDDGMSVTGKEKWKDSQFSAIRYDNDAGTLSFNYAGGVYVASTNGNTMTIELADDVPDAGYAGTYTRGS